MIAALNKPSGVISKASIANTLDVIVDDILLRIEKAAKAFILFY